MVQRILLLIATILSGFTTASAAERPVEHVVLVSVDGLAARYMNDSRAEMPNLHKIAAAGVAASGMRTVLPSLTWPSHTTIITGVYPAKHGVLGNSVWNRRARKKMTYIGDPELSKSQAVRVPTLYDAAHRAGLSTASVIWPCTNGTPTLDWVLPDCHELERNKRYTTPGMADELREAGIEIDLLRAWGWKKQYSLQRDQVYTQIIEHLLRTHHPNLTLMHLVTPDNVQHQYGPETPPAYKAIAKTDEHLGTIWKTLQQPPFAGKSAMFVVSDHGFTSYRKIIRPNALLVELGLVKLDSKDRVTKRDAWCEPQGGSAFIYVLDEQRRTEITEQLINKFTELEGVREILKPENFAVQGVPLPADNPEAPDFILTTGPGYAFDGKATGPTIAETRTTKGTHGYDPQADYMYATFVAAGAGIQSGNQLGVVDAIDVAPTIAQLLGIKMQADGEVIEGVLSP